MMRVRRKQVSQMKQGVGAKLRSKGTTFQQRANLFAFWNGFERFRFLKLWQQHTECPQSLYIGTALRLLLQSTWHMSL